MKNEMLNSNQIHELREGLRLRIQELEKRIVACKEIGQDEYVKYWEKSLNEAKIVNKAFDTCFVVTLQ
jgi:uncharacterized protein YwgA